MPEGLAKGDTGKAKLLLGNHEHAKHLRMNVEYGTYAIRGKATLAARMLWGQAAC